MFEFGKMSSRNQKIAAAEFVAAMEEMTEISVESEQPFEERLFNALSLNSYKKGIEIGDEIRALDTSRAYKFSNESIIEKYVGLEAYIDGVSVDVKMKALGKDWILRGNTEDLEYRAYPAIGGSGVDIVSYTKYLVADPDGDGYLERVSSFYEESFLW